ncbi:MAG: molybdenum cofactor biosynthesis protein MoaE [Candidatus Competibacteraceae bacterium]|nr:molybdenum cofactor biosynthesis protein MoaE [Candidatus Competibacteraceae bacterium]
MKVELRDAPFEPLVELGCYQAGQLELKGQYGATAIFIGTVRASNEQAAISRMSLEHYPGMTERYLQRIVETAAREWPLLDALVLHRVGELNPSDPIVLVAVWSAHRATAFAACRWIMEELKSKAPFWKREDSTAGSHWVEYNTPG